MEESGKHLHRPPWQLGLGLGQDLQGIVTQPTPPYAAWGTRGLRRAGEQGLKPAYCRWVGPRGTRGPGARGAEGGGEAAPDEEDRTRGPGPRGTDPTLWCQRLLQTPRAPALMAKAHSVEYEKPRPKNAEEASKPSGWAPGLASTTPPARARLDRLRQME